MPQTSTNYWGAEQNTKIPAITHSFSYRCQITANTTSTIPVNTGTQNPGQAVFPGIIPTGEPQTGRRFFCTEICVRDANGALGGSAGGSIALQNTTQNLTVVQSAAITTNVPYFRVPVQQGSCVVNPNDTLAIVYTAPTSGTATATGFTVDVFGFWQQGI